MKIGARRVEVELNRLPLLQAANSRCFGISQVFGSDLALQITDCKQCLILATVQRILLFVGLHPGLFFVYSEQVLQGNA